MSYDDKQLLCGSVVETWQMGKSSGQGFGVSDLELCPTVCADSDYWRFGEHDECG